MNRSCDVAVVGGGPAGIAAALAAAASGASVVLVDEADAVGGRLRYSVAVQPGHVLGLDGARGIEMALHAADLLAATAVEVVPRSVAWGLFDDNVLAVTTPDDSFELRAGRVVIATGSYDAVHPFPGWDLPGVMTATAALRLLHLHSVAPGRAAAVIGSGHVVDEVVAALELAGIAVHARATSAGSVAAGGDQQVEWIEVDGTRSLVDVVVIAAGRTPDPELAFQAGVATEFAPQLGCFLPARSTALETSLTGVYVAGACGGARSAAEAAAEGTVAGLAASGSPDLDHALEHLETLRSDPAPLATGETHIDALNGALQRLDAVPICRCEGICFADVASAVQEGATTINDVKRRTRAGMGLCQGIYCTHLIAGLIQQQTGQPLSTIGPMTPRPPARAIPLVALAGEEFR